MQLIPAYSLGATSPEETALVETLLMDCPEAIDELTDYLMLADALADLAKTAPVTQMRPPEVTKPSANHHIAPPSVGVREVPKIEDAPEIAEIPAPVSRHWGQRARWLAAAAVLALVVVVFGGTSIYLIDSVERLERGQDQLTAILTQGITPNDSLSVLTGNFLHRGLSATLDGTPTSRAAVIWNPDTSIGAVYATGLQPLDNEHHYQVWLVRGDETYALGQFTVDANGDGILLFQSEEPLQSFSAIGVNIEPIGETGEPTTPHLIVGEI